jgi:hypothetical protein
VKVRRDGAVIELNQVGVFPAPKFQITPDGASPLTTYIWIVAPMSPRIAPDIDKSSGRNLPSHYRPNGGKFSRDRGEHVEWPV